MPLHEAITAAIESLAAGRPLSTEAARLAIGAILDGEAGDVETAAFLTALHVKGETGDELLGAVEAIRERMIPFASGRPAAIDTCGTGGDRAATVNISTGTAVILAACGVPVVKHGNRAASGNSGSSDVLTELGIAIESEPALLRSTLDDLGLAFLFAPRFHPGMKTVAPVRRRLPFRTVFNLIGPLCNPASPAFQLVGAPQPAHAERMAEVLSRTSTIRRAAVVRGEDGLDEVTLAARTEVLLVEDGRIARLSWIPADFGLSEASASALRVENPAQSAAMLRGAFEGEPGPVREFLLANAAAAIWVVEQTPLPEAVARAARALDSGEAARLLERWARRTHGAS
ncbi:anthranilate phosphoribosyltransferase [Planctomyces sp. SH-PL62]|uniref:anthranilate phosphoribosyltransferase n=1 Tax=Planctomyces sp. SH-PL62 TaxID=1636152 RepID=UPI00078C9D7E|nr:anthranilate phosphoribosyltransferase [Planctomyces sp. SH-PL62]AMV39501.1 Anthranilate phosphoribosyltransferase [Planctomyces sp. SH-PL62]